eukprot:2848802-Pyramimonas_sp.AAC.1
MSRRRAACSTRAHRSRATASSARLLSLSLSWKMPTCSIALGPPSSRPISRAARCALGGQGAFSASNQRQQHGMGIPRCNVPAKNR